ncbi:MAG: biotin/lipoyl-binding protein [Nanoarchaeota archaeon]|nr:biotin/lipoyl-binding protein [Nanoarchaeota archaeon]
MEEFRVKIDGKEHVVSVQDEEGKLKISLEGRTYEVDAGLNKSQDAYDLDTTGTGAGEGAVKAALPGIIFSIDVKEGQEVKKGDKLLTLVAMKMENQVKAPLDGKIKKIHVKKDDKVNKGDALLSIE